MLNGTLQRLTAFSRTEAGGNPAGVWIGDRFPEDADMQALAAEVGYSETAFVVPATGATRQVRYFSPEAEVPFCGHATIATGVALANAEGDREYSFSTQAGEVRVQTQSTAGLRTAALTSVAPHYSPAPAELLNLALEALNWSATDIDQTIPPAIAFAGASHLVIAVTHKTRLDALAYDFDALKTIMVEAGLTTLQLIWRKDAQTFHVRNPFPVGGVVEDPATGAAAAALGGYLRDAGLVSAPAALLIHQGEVMGRPSELNFLIPATCGIGVSGAAVPITA